ncbi:MAG: LamG domain-containing protein [Chthoniobacterales bacterium]
MKNTPYLLLSLLTILLHAAPTRSFAENPNIYYYFEDNNDPTMPTNSYQGLSNIKYEGDTHQTTEQFKFGKGSMVVSEKLNPKGNNIGGFTGSSQDLEGDIHKMTITAWVRPADSKQFTLLSRLPASAAGSFSLVYSHSYKTFFFAITKSDGTRKSYTSAPLPFFEPNEWLHVALTFDEGKIVFYVNGLPIKDADATADGITTIPTPQGKQTLLGFSDSRPGTYVDDFGLFTDHALTEQEMDKVFNKGLEEFVKNSAPKK